MKLIKYLSTLSFFVLTISLSSLCQKETDKSNKQITNITPQRLDSLRRTFWDSLPQPIGYVNDFEKIYTNAEIDFLENLISDFDKKTTIQIAVVTFDTTMTSRDKLDSLTFRIANFWGVGQPEKENGVVIGISRGNRRMRIQNGKGIAKMITTTETKRIIDTVFIPSFREEKYFEGTLNGVKAIMALLESRLK